MVSVLERKSDHQKGATMFMAIVIMLLVGVLGVTIVEIGLMENKSSHYDWEEQQAQQAADAGVEWGRERIYLELQQPNNLILPTLPARLLCGNAEMLLAGDDETCKANIGEVVGKPGPINAADACTYEFTSTGSFRGARKVVTVQIVYSFTGGYQFQELDGQLSFMPRQYITRGRIINYTPSI
jgi:Tfp pilus assembly protein PilX